MTQHNDQPITSLVFPVKGRAAIYARKAASAGTQTTNPQTATLIEFANEQGFSNKQIIVYEEVGVSAKRPIALRGALGDLLTAIMQGEQALEQEPIKALYVSSEDRLFRDADAVDINYFLKACVDHGVTLITPTFTYDFTQESHVALFRFHCEEAFEYIATQVQRITVSTRQRRHSTKRAGE